MNEKKYSNEFVIPVADLQPTRAQLTDLKLRLDRLASGDGPGSGWVIGDPEVSENGVYVLIEGGLDGTTSDTRERIDQAVSSWLEGVGEKPLPTVDASAYELWTTGSGAYLSAEDSYLVRPYSPDSAWIIRRLEALAASGARLLFFASVGLALRRPELLRWLHAHRFDNHIDINGITLPPGFRMEPPPLAGGYYELKLDDVQMMKRFWDLADGDPDLAEYLVVINREDDVEVAAPMFPASTIRVHRSIETQSLGAQLPE